MREEFPKSGENALNPEVSVEAGTEPPKKKVDSNVPRPIARNALKLGIQRHCNITVVNITETITSNPDIPDPLNRYFLRYVQCSISFFQCWYLVKS
jgi:hypothetical protein